MLVFRALCGEWIQSLWDCMLVAGLACVPYFILIILIGNLVIVNMFLTLVLMSMSDLGCWDDDSEDKIQMAFGRFTRLKRFIVGKLCKTKRINDKAIESGEKKDTMEVPKFEMTAATPDNLVDRKRSGTTYVDMDPVLHSTSIGIEESMDNDKTNIPVDVIKTLDDGGASPQTMVHEGINVTFVKEKASVKNDEIAHEQSWLKHNPTVSK